MKNEQHQQAKNLYFQTNLSKTKIANLIGVNRRTIMLWSHQGNWDKLKKSAQHLPALVAEKCYYLIDHFTSHLLSTHSTMSTLSPKDAETIYRLAASIKKLKNRSTVNESMEMFNFFLEGLQRKNPGIAADLMPYVEEYMESRKDVNLPDLMLDGFTKDGQLPYPEKQIMEQWQDKKDAAAINQEFLEFSANHDAAAPGRDAMLASPMLASQTLASQILASPMLAKDENTLYHEFQKFVETYNTTPTPEPTLNETPSSQHDQAA